MATVQFQESAQYSHFPLGIQSRCWFGPHLTAHQAAAPFLCSKWTLYTEPSPLGSLVHYAEPGGLFFLEGRARGERGCPSASPCSEGGQYFQEKMRSSRPRLTQRNAFVRLPPFLTARNSRASRRRKRRPGSATLGATSGHALDPKTHGRGDWRGVGGHCPARSL